MDVIWPTDPSNIKFVFELPSISPVVSPIAESLTRVFTTYWQWVTFYLPLGIIGLWRWGTWLFKKTVAQFYHPKKGYFKTSVSVITPVYNENPKVFIDALVSWAKNSPQEIIAVIDYTDIKCLKIFEDFQKVFSKL